MKSIYQTILSCILAIMLATGFAFYVKATSSFNQEINYEGKLTDTSGVAILDGNYCMKFAIYDTACTTAPCSGVELWSEEWNAGSTKVNTTSGLFSILLGSHTAFPNIFDNANLYLQVQLDPSSDCSAGYTQTFLPRKQLGAVPAAIQSSRLENKTWEAPGTIGSTTANSGAFTTLSASSASGLTLGAEAATMTAGQIKLWSAGTQASNDFYTIFTAGSQTANVTYTLPTASANGLLKNASGTLSWDNSTYLNSSNGLLLDQTSPQTVINGAPIFDGGLRTAFTSKIGEVNDYFTVEKLTVNGTYEGGYFNGSMPLIRFHSDDFPANTEIGAIDGGLFIREAVPGDGAQLSFIAADFADTANVSSLLYDTSAKSFYFVNPVIGEYMPVTMGALTIPSAVGTYTGTNSPIKYGGNDYVGAMGYSVLWWTKATFSGGSPITFADDGNVTPKAVTFTGNQDINVYAVSIAGGKLTMYSDGNLSEVTALVTSYDPSATVDAHEVAFTAGALGIFTNVMTLPIADDTGSTTWTDPAVVHQTSWVTDGFQVAPTTTDITHVGSYTNNSSNAVFSYKGKLEIGNGHYVNQTSFPVTVNNIISTSSGTVDGALAFMVESTLPDNTTGSLSSSGVFGANWVMGNNTNYTGQITGVWGDISSLGTGTVAQADGFITGLAHGGSGTEYRTFTNFNGYSFSFGSRGSSSASEVINNLYQFKAFDFTGVPHFTIDTNYGIYIPDNTANATTSWGIYNLDRTYLEKGLTSNGSIAIVGGTSSQFLKADGSLDSSTYLTTDGTVTGAATQSQSFTNGITLNATSIVTDTTTGLIIGTGTTQKLGFFNQTPVAQPSGDILTALGTSSGLGLISSPSIAQADVTGLTTGSSPSFTALTATGANSLTLGTASSNLGAIIFKNASNSNTLTLNSGVTSTSYTITLPTATPVATYLLNMDASGTIGYDTSTYLTSSTGLLATGATTGAISQAQAFTNGVITGKIYPSADSTTAIQIDKADGSTNIINVDTTNGYVGIGTTTPGYTVDIKPALTDLTGNIYGVNNRTTYTPTASDSTYLTSAAMMQIYKNGAYDNTTVLGLRGVTGSAINNGAGNVTDLVASDASIQNLSSGIVTNGYAFYAQSPVVTADHRITNAYGLYIKDQAATGITNAYGIYQAGASDLNYFAGELGIGGSPAYGLDVAGTYTVALRGKVGIGAVPNSSYYLYVSGASYLSGALTATGAVNLSNTSALTLGASASTMTAGYLKFYSAGTSVSNNYYTTFTAGSQTANAAYTLPTASADGLLKNSSGALSWDTSTYLTSTTGLLATGATTGASLQSQVFTNGATLSNMTAKSVLFAGASGVVSQDNANFWWNSTNHRLGIGKTTPSYTLDVAGEEYITTTVNTSWIGGLTVNSSAGTSMIGGQINGNNWTTFSATNAQANGISFYGEATNAGGYAGEFTNTTITGTSLYVAPASGLSSGVGLVITTGSAAITSGAGAGYGSLLDVRATGILTTGTYTGNLVNIQASGANTAVAGSMLNINIAGTAQTIQAINISSATTQSTYTLMTMALPGITATSASGDVYILFTANSGNTQGKITRGTSANTVLYTTTSDARTKHNVKNDSKLSLSDVMNLKVRDYVMNSDASNTVQTGFVAQELYKVYPEAVAINNDSGTGEIAKGEQPWSIDYGRVTPLLAKAIQDQQKLLGLFSVGEGKDFLEKIQSENPKDPVKIIKNNIKNSTAFLTDFFVARISAVRGYFDETFATETHQKTLCVGDEKDGGETCLTKNQIDLLLQTIPGQNATGTSSIVFSIPATSSDNYSSKTPAPTTDDSTPATTPTIDNTETTPEIVFNNPATATFDISSLASIPAINVAYGTELALANLPTTVDATLSDNSTQSLTITWDNGSPSYDPNTAGTYVFSGTLTLPENVTNTNNLNATANVIIAQQEVPAQNSQIENPTDAVSEIVQTATSGLLNGIWNFIKLGIGLPIKKIASLTAMQEIKNDFANSINILQAGLFAPIEKMFGY